MARARQQRVRIAFDWAFLLLAVAFLAATGFRTVRLLQQRADQTALRFAQERAVREGRTLRQQLDFLAGETARLAAAGNADAGTVVQEMQRQGVNLRQPPGAAPAGPPH